MTDSVRKVYEIIMEQKSRVLKELKQKDAVQVFDILTRPSITSDGQIDFYKNRAYAYEIAEDVIDTIIERMESEGM